MINYNRRAPARVKREVYKTIVRSAMYTSTADEKARARVTGRAVKDAQIYVGNDKDGQKQESVLHTLDC